MRPRVAAPLIAIAIVFRLQLASATSLPTTSARLGAGSASVAACDENGFIFRLSVDTTGRVVNVNTSGIHSSCAGGMLSVTLVNGAANVGSGAVALPLSGFTGTSDIAISPQPLSTGISAVHASVVGP